MKTQLLQDLNESGSAQSKPTTPGAAEPVTRPRPSVSHRPQAAQDAAVQPKGFAPQPPAFSEPIPPPPETTEPWPPADGTGDKVPAWLAERLALDAEEQNRSERKRLLIRRLGAWGAAGVLLALLASGGLYLYDQSQVEGALTVVANTNPAPASAAPRLETAHASRALPASAEGSPGSMAPITPITPAPAMPGDTEGRAAVGGSAGASTAAGEGPAAPEAPGLAAATASGSGTARPEPAADSPPDITPPPRRERNHVRKRVKAEASAKAADSGTSARQRREETLMQCRAHGYDDRQCLQRGCEMTRYGFACKG